MSRSCPQCKLMNPANAARCDCGYDFTSGYMEGSYLAADELESFHTGTFWGGFAAGLIGGCIGLAIVYMINAGSETKRGALFGFGASFVLGCGIRGLLILGQS